MKQQEAQQDDSNVRHMNTLIQETFQKFQKNDFSSLSDSEIYQNFKQIEHALNNYIKMAIKDNFPINMTIQTLMEKLEICLKELLKIDFNLSVNKELDHRYWYSLKLFLDYAKKYNFLSPPLITKKVQLFIECKTTILENQQNLLLIDLVESSKPRQLLAHIISWITQMKLTFNIGPDAGQSIAESLYFYPFHLKSYEYSLQISKQKKDHFGILYAQIRARDLNSKIEWINNEDKEKKNLLTQIIDYVYQNLEEKSGFTFTDSLNKYLLKLESPQEQDVQFMIRTIILLIFSEQKSLKKNNLNIFYKNFDIVTKYLNYLLPFVKEEKFLNVVSLILYYYSEHAQQLKHCFKDQQYVDILLKLRQNLKMEYEKQSLKYEIDNTILNDIILNYYFQSDIQLVAFSPLKPFFKRIKKSRNVYDSEQTLLPKLHLNVKLIDKICTQLNIQDRRISEEVDVGALDNIFGDKKKEITFETKEKVQSSIEPTMIVIDGMNVALRKTQKHFSSSGLKQAVDFFLNRGHQVQIFLPDYILHPGKNRREDPKKTADNFEIIQELLDQNIICGVPSWEYVTLQFQDDSYAIDYAQKKNGFILTNDRYNDNIQRYGQNDQTMENELRKWIRNHCISYTFVNDEFLPSKLSLVEYKL